MGLPKLQHPVYETKLTSMEKPIKFRPFLSKEEKILLMALAGGDKDEMTRAVKQVIGNCVLDEDFKLDKLPSFDLEYLFVMIRAKSVGDKVTLKFHSRENTDCRECKKEKDVILDLNDIKVLSHPEHKKKFEVAEGVGVVMKYPTPNQWMDIVLLRNNFDVELQYKLTASCIEYIYDQATVYDILSENIEQAISWLEDLPATKFAEVFSFFSTMPHLEHRIDLSCSECGYKDEYVLEGIESFFA